MEIAKDNTYDIEEVIEYIKLKLLQEDGIELSFGLLDSILAYEMDYLVEKGIAVVVDPDEEDDE